MPRLDVHDIDGTLVVDLQHDMLDHLPTRVVAPLLPPDRADQPVRDLHLTVVLPQGRFVLTTHLLATVPRRELGPVVGNLDARHDAVQRALDILLLSGI